MKIYKRRSKNPLQCYEYSITHLTEKEMVFLSFIMANLRFDVPLVDHVGTFEMHYNGYNSLAPAPCTLAADAFRALFSDYSLASKAIKIAEPQIKFDIDDVL